MEVYYFIVMFILGTVLGSFYNVVGYRMPKGQSIIMPPSHCTNCNHKLTAVELVPIVSYIIQGGKCKNCKEKISPFYMIFEFITGLLFALSYLKFGFTVEIIIPLTFISLLVIITVSDYNYMIINDSVLIFFAILLGIEVLAIYGVKLFLLRILQAILAFLTMFGLKKLGDFIFKKESMGGGDIKLMGIFGLVMGYPMSLLSIFIGSVAGLPLSLITLKNNSHILAFGPLLAFGALVIMFLGLDMDTILKLYE